jgi:two-component system LytT family response regulator/two-component system response regulator LytT
MIRSFIVDDEEPARNEFKRFLQKEVDFELVGEAVDGEDALNGIRRLKPNVVFLDIHIPKMNGLEVAGELAKLSEVPLIVFVTAFDEYAIQAFDVSAIDYILKPYDRDRFQKACAKIRNAMGDQSAAKKKLDSLNQYLEKDKPLKIVGRSRKSRDRVLIHPRDVVYFHVELTEVTARLDNGDELLVNATLKSLLDSIDPNQFQQTHRSYVVNLDRVEKVQPLFSGNFDLLLKDSAKSVIPLSRRYAQKLKKLVKW